MPEGIMPIAVLIVEDDLSFALELEMLVEEIGYQVVAAVDSSAGALEIMYAGRVDFILMDIDIKGRMTGLELGKKIRPLNIPVLFLTSFGNEAHYEEAQKSNLVGYLVKPIDKYTLRTAISLAIGQLFTVRNVSKPSSAAEGFLHKEYLFLKHDSIYKKIAERDIVIVEGSDDYVNIHLRDGRVFVMRKTLKAMSSILSGGLFIRVHRSYLVNVSAIDQIDIEDSKLRVGDVTIPLSRQRRAELEKLIRKVE